MLKISYSSGLFGFEWNPHLHLCLSKTSYGTWISKSSTPLLNTPSVSFFFFNLVFEFTTKEGSMSETSPKHPQNLQNDISPPTISPVQALGKYNSSTSTFAYPPQVVRQRNHASGLIVKVTIKLKPSMWEIYGNLGSYGLEGIR